MSTKLVNTDSLVSVANAIREKGETTGQLVFPDGFVSAIENIQIPTFTTEEKSVTPTESEQVITPSSDKDGLSKVTVGAISSTYVGSGVYRPISTFYAITGVDADSNDDYYIINSTMDLEGLSSGAYVLDGTPSQSMFPKLGFGTAQQSQVLETATFSSVNGLAIQGTMKENGYVSHTITTQGGTYSIPEGYTSGGTITASVKSGTEGTPTATKGSVSNNQVTITPSVTNTEGYISGGTKSGTGVTVSASELVSGNKSITPTETAQNNIDVTNNATVSVGAISSTYIGSGVAQKSSSDLTVSGATVTVPSGYYSAQATKSVASGSAGTPSANKGTVSNHQITVTPSVTNTTGYIAGGTKTGSGVTVSASELVSGSQDITENGSVDVTNLASVTVNVPSPTFITVRVGSEEPSASIGSVGDIYLKVQVDKWQQ